MDNYGFTSKGIRYPKWLAKIANRTASESLRDDLEELARGADAAISDVAVDVSNKVNINDPRLPSVVSVPGIIGVLVDRMRNHTWIGARSEDGGPTDLALWHMNKRLGVRFRQSAEYMFELIDGAYNRTDLTIRKSDGQFADFVVERLGKRLGVTSGVSSGDLVLSEDQLIPLVSDTSKTGVFGSSTSQSFATYIADLLGSATVVHNEGKSGERYQQIFARQGSRPALITVTGGSIPASGSVTASASNMLTNRFLKPFTGTLAGVHGTLASTDTEMTFTRTTPGSTVNVPAGTPFISDKGDLLRSSFQILCMAGKNNDGDTGSAPEVIQATIDAYKWLLAFSKRAIVMGHFIDTHRRPGDVQYIWAETVNAGWKAFFGPLYFDTRAYLSSPQLWEDTGITPTQADLDAQAIGVKPPSVSENDSHLGPVGYAAVAKRVREHLRGLGYF